MSSDGSEMGPCPRKEKNEPRETLRKGSLFTRV